MKSHFISGVAVVAILLGTVISSTAGGSSFTRGCAARDMQILVLLEQQERREAVGAQQVREVLTTIFDARMVCFSGRVLDALALYDTVARRMTAERIFSGGMN